MGLGTGLSPIVTFGLGGLLLVLAAYLYLLTGWLVRKTGSTRPEPTERS